MKFLNQKLWRDIPTPYTSEVLDMLPSEYNPGFLLHAVFPRWGDDKDQIHGFFWEKIRGFR